MALESQKEKMAASKGGTLGDYIRMLAPKMNILLPESMDKKQYLNALGTIITSDAQFAVPNLDKITFKDGILKCAQAGVLPNTTSQEAYLTVLKDGRVKFMLGLGGRLKAATEAGLQVHSREVRKNDIVSLERELSTGSPETVHLVFKEGVPDRGPVIGYCATYVNLNNLSDSDALIVSKEQVEEHRKNSGGGPTWSKHFDAMAKNYTIKQLLRHYQFDLNGNDHVAAIMADEDTEDQDVVETAVSTASIMATKAGPVTEKQELKYSETEKKQRKKRAKSNDPEPVSEPEKVAEETSEVSETEAEAKQISLLPKERSDDDEPF